MWGDVAGEASKAANGAAQAGEGILREQALLSVERKRVRRSVE